MNTMSEKRYYEILERIPNQKSVNGCGYITSDGIPFYSASDAVKYAMKKFETVEPGFDAVVFDPDKCREAAYRMGLEIHHMIEVIDEMIESKHAEINRTVEEINRLSDRDLLESVHKKVLTDDLYRKQGEHSGLVAANAILRDRFSEFLNCKGLRGGAA